MFLFLLSLIAGAQEDLVLVEKIPPKVREPACIGQYLDTFFTDCGRYPTTTEGLRALMVRPKDCKRWGFAGKPYIDKVPVGLFYSSKDPLHFELRLNGKAVGEPMAACFDR